MKLSDIQQELRRLFDALRCEVAAELAETLERNTKGSCELASMQATFPSVTSCGMASLLPCGNLSMDATEPGGLRVLLDGSEVDTTATRQKQLRRSDPHAVAITYDSLANEMSASLRKDLVKNAQARGQGARRGRDSASGWWGTGTASRSTRSRA